LFRYDDLVKTYRGVFEECLTTKKKTLLLKLNDKRIRRINSVFLVLNKVFKKR
jgi:hypothetical protein